MLRGFNQQIVSIAFGTAMNAALTIWKLVALTLGMLVLGTPGAARSQDHPLDPLSWDEHWTVLEILRAEGRIDESTRFFRIALVDPEKEAVWSWSPQAKAPARRAEVILRHNGKLIESVVDLHRAKVSAWNERTGVQAQFLTEETGSSGLLQRVKQDPRFLAGLKRRGVTDPLFVDCTAQPPGSHGEALYARRRVAKVFCRPKARVRNFWARRIEGLSATVDLDTKEILEIVDEEVAPVSPVTAEYDAESLGGLREFPTPLRVERPTGPSFRRTGNVIQWDGWRFHIRSDQRVGLIVSAVTYGHGEDRRRILYEGRLSEIFVPYMDPRADWYSRTYLDAGEFSTTGLAGTLTEGVDCPADSEYLDAIIVGSNGRPEDKRRVACVFERVGPGPSWRHAADGRPQRQLVVRNVAFFGNYDYLMDWVFQPDGTLRVAVGATGIVEAKMSSQKDASEAAAPGSPAGDAYGRYVGAHLVAVNHDHFFNFRLDVDVDGAANTLVVDEFKTTELPAEHPRRSVWTVDQRAPRTEGQARLNMDMHHPALWRVTSASRRNAVGYPTSYELMPSMSAHTLLTEDDYPRRRAAFINHDLWVTRYQPEERYAAGEYPTLSGPGEGLPQWSTPDEVIEKADIVLWYTIGMHHMVRGEDWPVMPVLWHEFLLRPFDFFDRNPAVDLGRRP